MSKLNWVRVENGVYNAQGEKAFFSMIEVYGGRDQLVDLYQDSKKVGSYIGFDDAAESAEVIDVRLARAAKWEAIKPHALRAQKVGRRYPLLRG